MLLTKVKKVELKGATFLQLAIKPAAAGKRPKILVTLTFYSAL
jgi:hypothetical protein